nr:unnamed protein product [Callosobruchus chinensis]
MQYREEQFDSSVTRP